MNPVGVVSGKVYVLDRSDVDTDQIIPAQYLKRIERTGFGQFLFDAWVKGGEVVLHKAPILAAGRNFGCGSSREHAPWAIQDYGFEVVIAPSIADIFYSNCTKIGLLPVVLPEKDMRDLMAAGNATVDLAAQSVSFGGRTVGFEIDAEIKHRLLNGLDDIGLTLAHGREIEAFERSAGGPLTTSLQR